MAWTTTLKNVKANQEGFNYLELEYEYTSDANTGTHEIIHRRMKGMYLLDVVTNPAGGSDAPSGVYTVTLSDIDGVTIDTLTNRSTTATERVNIPASISKDWIMNDGELNVSIATLGDGNKTTIKYIFVAQR